jgi:tetratricopeptide (TPR) repeat protein
MNAQAATSDWAEDLLDRAERLSAGGDHDAALASWLEVLGIWPEDIRANYNAGLAYQRKGEMVACLEHLQRSELAPGFDHDLMAFKEMVSQGEAFRLRQESAVRRGMSALLIASLPKSASATVSYFLADLLSLPVCRISAATFPQASVVPNMGAAAGLGRRHHARAFLGHRAQLGGHRGERHRARAGADP